jgi:hypothetical protein
MAAQLAPVYVDNNRIVLQGDPKPNVAKIVTTAGKRPEKVKVLRLEAQTDTEGAPLQANDVIDRTMDVTQPIYLRFVDQAGQTQTGKTGNVTAPLPNAPSKNPSGTNPSFTGQTQQPPGFSGKSNQPSNQPKQNPGKQQPWKQSPQEEPAEPMAAGQEEAPSEEEE